MPLRESCPEIKGQPIVRVTGSLEGRAGATGVREHADKVIQTERARSRAANIRSSCSSREHESAVVESIPLIPPPKARSYSWRSKSFSAPACQTFNRLFLRRRIVRIHNPRTEIRRLRGFLTRLDDLDLRHVVSPTRCRPLHAPAKRVPIQSWACDTSACSCPQAPCAKRPNSRPRKPG